MFSATATPELSHSRLALGCVVAAHVAIAWSAVHLLERKPVVDPLPITVALLREELPVDEAPRPLPMAPKPPPPKVIPPEPKHVELPPPPEIERKAAELPPPPEPQRAVEKPPAPVEPTPQLAPAPQAITVPPAPVALGAPVAAPAPTPPPVVHEPEIAPMFNAEYLNNPTPVYPPLSRRMGEQGLVLLRVFVTAHGDPNAVELKTGSGFARLDRAAQEAVKQWKFVPAKRGEQAVDAWVVVPIRFSLKG
jgi:periplasmic protein TonB